MARNNLPPESQQYLRQRDAKLDKVVKDLEEFKSQTSKQSSRLAQAVGVNATRIQPFFYDADDVGTSAPEYNGSFRNLGIMYDASVEAYYDGSYSAFIQTLTPQLLVEEPGGSYWGLLGTENFFYQPANAAVWATSISGFWQLSTTDLIPGSKLVINPVLGIDSAVSTTRQVSGALFYFNAA